MSGELMDPPVPATLEVASWTKYMPLDVAALMNSRFIARSTGPQFKAAVLLWCAAWMETPTGSLPDDDEHLCYLARYPRHLWSKERQKILSGFEKASDGRLYHRFVCQQAMAAHTKREEKRAENAARTRAATASRSTSRQRHVERHVDVTHVCEGPKGREEKRSITPLPPKGGGEGGEGDWFYRRLKTVEALSTLTWEQDIRARQCALGLEFTEELADEIETLAVLERDIRAPGTWLRAKYEMARRRMEGEKEKAAASSGGEERRQRYRPMGGGK